MRGLLSCAVVAAVVLVLASASGSARERHSVAALGVDTAAAAGAVGHGALLGTATSVAVMPSVSVIPTPRSAAVSPGSFTVSSRTPVVASSGEAERIARYLVDLVARTRGLPLQVQDGGEVERSAIELRLEDTAPAGEGYELNVSPRGALIRAREPHGLFYGAVSLWQLMTADVAPRDSSVTLRSVKISDAPRFSWRGFMLDSARHYQPPEFIKQMLDAMALHKLNTFHWHLTDDQGWRLQINKYPLLTEVGAWRVPAGSGPASDIDPATGKPRLYGGFYTQAEVRDVVRYAAERFITVVPEIEMPGHAQAPIAAYPQLGTDPVAPPVSSDWGVHDYLFNVDESTFSFLEDVLTEVIALFPGPYVHIGGDEAVKDRWRASPAIQKRMRELGVADEAALQSYFTHRMEKFLSAQGRRLIGWDEILEGGLPPSATVMSWRGTEGAIEAVNAGHDVVMSPVPALYLDYLQSDLPDEPGGRPTYQTLQNIYEFKVLPEAITGDAAGHVLGAQMNAWTEHMRTPQLVQHAVFPRMAAFSEVVWSGGGAVAPAASLSSDLPRGAALKSESSESISTSPTAGKLGTSAPYHGGWQDFLRRLPAQLARYRKLGISYADSAFAVAFKGTTRVELSNQVATGEIRYTLNGSPPTASSKLYSTPIAVTPRTTITAATFINGHAVSSPRTHAYDRATQLRRTDTELKSCSNKLILRLEDDAPRTGERPFISVDILDPCWIWEKADLSHVTAISANVAQLPFNFQVGDATKQIPLIPPESEAGELEVRKDSCEGERIAVLPLAPAVGNPQITTLPRTPLMRSPSTPAAAAASPDATRIDVAASPNAARTSSARPAAAAADSAPNVHDLCLRFTRRSIDPIWAIQSVQLYE